MDFIHYRKAWEDIFSLGSNFKSGLLDLEESLGKYLSEDIYAPMDVPAFSNSAMDGFGFTEDTPVLNKAYSVVAEIKAGMRNLPEVPPDKAVRIFTGAPVPDTVTTIVMQEQCIYHDNEVQIKHGPVEKNMNIRHRGTQTQKGSLIASQGTRISPGLIALLAGFGLKAIPVFVVPDIGILITGDELTDAGSPLESGQIYESNGVALVALLESLRLKPKFVYKLNDELKEIGNKVKESLEACDILIMTGGVSVGDYDYVQAALMANQVEKVFYKIRQKPGKPFFLGKKGQKIIFALPGNPASVFTCFHVYVLPFLMRMMSGGKIYVQTGKAKLSHDFAKKKGLTHFYKCSVVDGKITILAGQESYRMDSFSVANGFCIVEEEIESIFENDELEYINICQ